MCIYELHYFPDCSQFDTGRWPSSINHSFVRSFSLSLSSFFFFFFCFYLFYLRFYRKSRFYLKAVYYGCYKRRSWSGQYKQELNLLTLNLPSAPAVRQIQTYLRPTDLPPGDSVTTASMHCSKTTLCSNEYQNMLALLVTKQQTAWPKERDFLNAISYSYRKANTPFFFFFFFLFFLFARAS